MEVASLYREPEIQQEIAWGALELRDVFRIYRSGPAETVALRGFDLRIERGELVAVFGPSGSGKSTMLQLAAGLDQPSAGEVRVLGRPLGRMSERELAAYRARGVSIVFQDENVLSWLDARANVELALALAGREREAAGPALELVGLSNRAGVVAGALSGGERQRVAIAAAAARRSPLVLADEPTAELDEANERLVLGALRDLRDAVGSAVVVVTHSVAVAEAVDRVVEIRDGRVV